MLVSKIRIRWGECQCPQSIHQSNNHLREIAECKILKEYTTVYLKRYNNVSSARWKQWDHVKGFARTDEPAEDYHLDPQLPSTLWSFIVSFGSLLRCPAHNLGTKFWVTLNALITLFWATGGSWSAPQQQQAQCCHCRVVGNYIAAILQIKTVVSFL